MADQPLRDADDVVAQRLRENMPSNPLDLLTDEQKVQLQADLEEMAACRRRAWAAIHNLVLGARNDGTGCA